MERGLHFVSELGTIVPIMSTKDKKKGLLAGLFGKTRRSILALLYSHPDESYYLRQILRLAGVAPGAGQRELRWLSDVGIVRRTVSGNQVYFQANSDCSIFSELRSLVTKTVGVGDIVRSALVQLKERLNLVLLYGSVAYGEETRDSDVDVLIVGNVTFAEIVEKLSPAQNLLGREINPTVYELEEFLSKVRNGHHFLDSVLNEEFIYLIGDKSELERLVGKRMAR